MGNHNERNATGLEPVRVVCAPGNFRGSISAIDAAEAMQEGARRAGSKMSVPLQVDQCPMADGGPGTFDVLMRALGGQPRAVEVVGPLGRPILARFGVTADRETGIVELAEASGLDLISVDQRDPMSTTTFGTGQLIQWASDAGCTRIIVGLGGSATNDGGAGLAQALGVRFYDGGQRPIEEPLTGAMLQRIRDIALPDRLPQILVACDVDNPLLGPNGAAEVYGPQKCRDPNNVARADIQRMENALTHLALIVRNRLGNEENQPDPTALGAGAAGGAGFGLAAICRAVLEMGSRMILQEVGFNTLCKGATLVVTGKGCLDGRSLGANECMVVAKAAEALDVPTVAIVGRTGPGYKRCVKPSTTGKLAEYVSLADRFGRDLSMRATAALIESVMEEIVLAWVPDARR